MDLRKKLLFTFVLKTPFVVEAVVLALAAMCGWVW